MKYLRPEDVAAPFKGLAISTEQQTSIARALESLILERMAAPSTCFSCDEDGDYDTYVLCTNCEQEQLELKYKIAAKQLQSFSKYLLSKNIISSTCFSITVAGTFAYLNTDVVQIQAVDGAFKVDTYTSAEPLLLDSLGDVFYYLSVIGSIRPTLNKLVKAYEEYKAYLTALATETIDEI